MEAMYTYLFSAVMEDFFFGANLYRRSLFIPRIARSDAIDEKGRDRRLQILNRRGSSTFPKMIHAPTRKPNETDMPNRACTLHPSFSGGTRWIDMDTSRPGVFKH